MAYEGLLSGLADEDKYLGLLGIGLGMLAGNQGRSRQQAMANSFGGATQGGLGLLGPIMQNKQQQAQRAMAERQFGLEERKVGGQEELNKTHAKLYQEQVEQMRRQQAALERAFPSEQQPTTGLLAPQQSPQAMIDAGGGAYMQTAPMVQQATQQTGARPQIDLDKLRELAINGVNIEPYLKLREAGQYKINDNIVYDPNQLPPPGTILSGTTTTPQGQSIIREQGGAVRNAPGSFEAQMQNRLPEAIVNRAFSPVVPLGMDRDQRPILRNQEQATAAAGARDPLEILAPFLRGTIAPANQGLESIPAPLPGTPDYDAYRRVANATPSHGGKEYVPTRATVESPPVSRTPISPTRTPISTTGMPTGPTARDKAEQEAEKARLVGTAEADVSIGKIDITSLQKEAGAWRDINNIVTQIEERLDNKEKYGGVVGVGLADRAQMRFHDIGIQTPATINTKAIQQLGQSLVLARGSLGTGVSIPDAERYDKAAGAFSMAKSEADMRASIAVMKNIQDKYARQVNEQMQRFRETGQAPSRPVNAPKIGEVIQGYRFKGGNPSDRNNWERQ